MLGEVRVRETGDAETKLYLVKNVLYQYFIVSFTFHAVYMVENKLIILDICIACSHVNWYF